ncbi:MAG TPA: hypothetical protein VEH31_15170, partial [Streptosporangiaceae bacterium]|nr:hypothetical protein [Streptosporangiaceae bacterium]
LEHISPLRHPLIMRPLPRAGQRSPPATLIRVLRLKPHFRPPVAGPQFIKPRFINGGPRVLFCCGKQNGRGGNP